MGRKSQIARLDHSVWIHDDPEVDRWMLYVQDSPWTGKARAMCRGSSDIESITQMFFAFITVGFVTLLVGRAFAT